MAPHPPPPKPNRLLTPSEAAGFLSVSLRTLTRLTAMGDLPHARIGGQRRCVWLCRAIVQIYMLLS
jgi:excisionase family DNA binding protein